MVVLNANMMLHCLEANTGKVVWVAGPLPGPWKRSDLYRPVIHQGKVIITLGRGDGWRAQLQQECFGPIGEPIFEAGTEEDIIGQEQDIVLEFMEADPGCRSMVVFNLADGKEPYTCSVVRGCGENGQPVVVAGDGQVYTTFYTSAANDGFRGNKPTHCGLGRLDLSTGRSAEPLLSVPDEVGAKLGLRDSPCELTDDEPVPLSSGGNMIWSMRTNQNPGAIHVTTRTTVGLPETNVPWASDLHHATGGPVIHGPYVLYIKFSRLICVRGNLLQ